MAEANKLPVSVVISAVDNVTYKVMAINEKIKRITAPVSKVQKAFSLLSEQSGLTQLGKSLSKVGSTGKEFFSELGGAIVKVAAVGIAAAVSIYGLVHSFAEAGDEIANVAARLGLTTDAFQELSYAALQSGVDQDTFNSSMGRLSRGTAEAAVGQGEALVAFNAMGISVRDSSGHLRDMESLLPEIANKLKMVHSQSLRNALATKIFGKEGMKMNGILMEGAEGLEKLRKEARDVGAVMTPEQIKSAKEFDNSFKSIFATLMMVRNIVAAALAPALVGLGKTLQKTILDNKDKITAFAKEFADKLPGFIDMAVTALLTFGRVVMKVVDAISWFQKTFGTTATLITGFALYFSGLTIAAIKFAVAISGALVPALQLAWTGFSLIFGVLQALAVGLAAIVGWPVLIGAAFVAAALVIWKYWEPISKMVDKVASKIKGFFGFNGGEVKGTLSTEAPQLGPAMGLGKTVDAAQRSSSVQNENHVLVELMGLPPGSTVETKKSDGGLDLTMGYGMAGGTL